MKFSNVAMALSGLILASGLHSPHAAAFLIPISSPLFPLVSSQADASGIYVGALKIGAQSLRIVFHISKKPDGGYSATLDSPDQQALGIPTSSTTIADGKVRIEAKVLGAAYDGKFSADGKTIEGSFSQGGNELPLSLTKVEKAPEAKKYNRPQEPKPPFPYNQREVSYENKAANIKLAGTLTLPKGAGPFPAVVLITGSGAQDRNETLMGHKPFLLLADYFTRRGIAVLRVDDRGVGGSTGSTPNSTTEDFVGDVLTGVDFLKTQKEINPKKIGLVGHSEGGLIGPMCAARSKDIAFVVMMAGPGLVGEKIIKLQGALIMKAGGVPADVVDKQLAKSEPIYKIIREAKTDAEFSAKMTETLGGIYDALTEQEKKAVGAKDIFIKGQFATVGSPWFRYFFTLDPKLALVKVTCPVLALNGEKDLQVPPKEDLEAIGNYLKQAGNKDYTLKLVPGVNHLFQTCKTGSPSEYENIEETISPVALKIMGDWILAHTK